MYRTLSTAAKMPKKKQKSLKAVGLQILREKKRIQNEKQKKILKRCRSAVFKERKSLKAVGLQLLRKKIKYKTKKKILKSCRPAAFKEKKTNTKRKTKKSLNTVGLQFLRKYIGKKNILKNKKTKKLIKKNNPEKLQT